MYICGYSHFTATYVKRYHSSNLNDFILIVFKENSQIGQKSISQFEIRGSYQPYSVNKISLLT